jgi:hypothetical protein
MQIKLDRLYVDRYLRTVHAAEERDDLSTKYYCRIIPVHESKKFTLGNTYSLTKEGKFYTNFKTEHSNDAIIEIDETIIDGSIALYILSDLFEQCWITEKYKIRMRINKNWFDATYEQNGLAHIDSQSNQRRAILAKFSFSCDQRLSKKYNKLFDILRNGTKQNVKSN